MPHELAINIKYVLAVSFSLGAIVLAMYIDRNNARRSLTFLSGVVILILSGYATIALGDIPFLKVSDAGTEISTISVNYQIIFLLTPILISGLGIALITHSILAGIDYEKEDSLLMSLVHDATDKTPTHKKGRPA